MVKKIQKNYEQNTIMGTICQFKLKIKIPVTKLKKLKSEVAVRENVKN